MLVLAIAAIVLTTTSCRKAFQEKQYVTIETNQTAFVIPLEGANKKNQGKFDSEAFLEENKVAAKRIEIPTRWHSTGRTNASGKWIPTVKVITVDRTPVTKKWLKKANDLNVESMESISFGVGVTVTCAVPEEYTSKFLYHYNGKALAVVVESDVRPFIQGVLTSEFGTRLLENCQKNRKEVYSKMRLKTKEYFAQYGIEIKQIAAVGGFTYESAKIQAAIDAKFESAQKVISSKNEVAAANNFLKAGKAIKAQKELEADLGIQEALAESIRKGTYLKNVTTLVIGDGNTDMTDVYHAKKMAGH